MRAPLLSMLVVLHLGSACLWADGEATRPNIVFILADDMNRDTWGAYGSVDCKTPHIDRLASEGMRFERIYCAVAMFAPFRQELYSGRSPWRTGTLPNHSKSKPDTRSIPHYLKPLGYRVALVGKSHVGPGECYPFEYFPGDKDKSRDPNPGYLKNAREFIDSCTQEGKPFCLFIASSDSHGPYTTGDQLEPQLRTGKSGAAGCSPAIARHVGLALQLAGARECA